MLNKVEVPSPRQADRHSWAGDLDAKAFSTCIGDVFKHKIEIDLQWRTVQALMLVPCTMIHEIKCQIWGVEFLCCVVRCHEERDEKVLSRYGMKAFVRSRKGALTEQHPCQTLSVL